MQSNCVYVSHEFNANYLLPNKDSVVNSICEEKHRILDRKWAYHLATQSDRPSFNLCESIQEAKQFPLYQHIESFRGHQHWQFQCWFWDE